MKFFIAVFFLMVLTACAVQTEEIEESVQEIVSTAISLPIIPTAQSVEALTIPTETPTEIPTRDVVKNSPVFANGEATALVKERIHNELVNVSDSGNIFNLIQRHGGEMGKIIRTGEADTWIPEYWTIDYISHINIYGEVDTDEETIATKAKCVPLIQTYFGLVEFDSPNIRQHLRAEGQAIPSTTFKINEEGGLQFTEMYQAEHQAWYVSLNHGGTFDDVYIWKVYESTGTVERFDVPRDYC